MAEYNVTVDMWWGRTHQFCDQYRFSVSKITEIPKWIRRHIIRFTRRYTYDCSDMTHPLHPWIGNIKIEKVEWTKYESGTLKYKTFMDAEIEWVKELIETKNEFINGNYNETPAPKNRRIMQYKQRREFISKSGK